MRHCVRWSPTIQFIGRFAKDRSTDDGKTTLVLRPRGFRVRPALLLSIDLARLIDEAALETGQGMPARRAILERLPVRRMAESGLRRGIACCCSSTLHMSGCFAVRCQNFSLFGETVGKVARHESIGRRTTVPSRTAVDR